MPLATKYRPQSWQDLVGQESAVQILKKAVSSNLEIPLYVLSGPRGTGKTTVARILAKAVNCTESSPDPCLKCEVCIAIGNDACPDVVELDAASNGGVNAIRALRNSATYRPMQAKIRVFILDEAHAMTSDAFQAMLKILEEPPPGTLFIMATTEVHLIPDTIMSRAFPFEFRLHSTSSIVSRLKYIAQAESLTFPVEVLTMIAEASSGALRDAISMMEQVSLLDTITEETARAVLGTLTRTEVAAFFKAVAISDVTLTITWLKSLRDRGFEPRAVLSSISNYMVLLLEVKSQCQVDLSPSEFNTANELAKSLSKDLIQLARELAFLDSKLRSTLVDPFDLLTLSLFSLVTRKSSTPLS